MNYLLYIFVAIATLTGGLAYNNFGGEENVGLAKFLSIQLADSPQNGYILQTDGTNNSWVINSGGGAGGSGVWSTTTDNLAIYNNTGDAVIISGTATNTDDVIEIHGDASLQGLLTVNSVNATSSTASILTGGVVLQASSTITTGNLSFSNVDLSLLGTSADILSDTDLDLYPDGQTTRSLRLSDDTTNIDLSVTGGGALDIVDDVTITGTDINFTGYDCSGNANGGALTVDASGNVTCSDDDSGAGGSSEWTDSGNWLVPNETEGIIVSASSTFVGDLTVSSSSESSIRFYNSNNTNQYQERRIFNAIGTNDLGGHATSSALIGVKNSDNQAEIPFFIIPSAGDNNNYSPSHLFLGHGAGNTAYQNGVWDVGQQPTAGATTSASMFPVTCIGYATCASLTWNANDVLGFDDDAPYASVALGSGALSATTDGARGVVAIGTNAMEAGGGNLEGSIAIGLNAMPDLDGEVESGLIGSYGKNIVIGAEAGTAMDSTTNDICIGDSCMRFGPAYGDYNVCVGSSCMYQIDNSAYPITSNSESEFNTGIGDRNFRYTLDAFNSTAIGANSARAISTSTNNTFLGFESGKGEYCATGTHCFQTVDNSTFLGYQTGLNIGTSTNNLLVGYQVGSTTLSTGSNNILIGYGIDTPASDTSNYLSIGNLIFSDSINDVTGSTLSSANLGIGTTTPTAKLTVDGDFRVDSLISCDTIDTDSNGTFVCGTDASGGGGGVWEDLNGTAIKLVDITDQVVIGASATTSDEVLEVTGNVAFSSRIQHLGDTNTYFQMADDALQYYAGGDAFFFATEDVTDVFQINPLSSSINFQVNSGGDQYAIFVVGETGQDGEDNVGIGTSTPQSKLTVSGSFAVGTNGTEFTVDTSGNTVAQSLSINSAGHLVIPTGTNPTTDASGELAFDTTDNQIVINNGTTDLVIPTQQKIISFTVASTSVEFVSGGVIPFPPQRDAFALTEFACYVDGGTSVVVNLSDGTNDTETITCGTTLTTDTDVATNDTFTAGELGEVQIGTITGTPDYLTFTAYGTITRE